jgi:cytochrome c biogenesis protein ResB
MNEPLKHGGYTLYQASFQQGPTGEPIASILSVNYDPGRWIKYLGSLIICLGVIWLFYQKRRTARAQAPKVGAIEA